MTIAKHQIAPLPNVASRLSDHRLSLSTLRARIDALPMRQREMRDAERPPRT